MIILIKNKLKKEEDTVPGEELILQILLREVNGEKEYWAYLGNHGEADGL